MIPIIYDQINKLHQCDEFIISLINSLNIKHIADLGCGTGRITIPLAKTEFHITAIDPNHEAIELAKMKPSKGNINWIVGDSTQLLPHTYEAVMMTANVSQVFTTEESWQAVLSNVYRSLQVGGHFIFDARNPMAREWEKWEADLTPDYAIHPATGEPLEIWTEYDGFVHDVYTFYDIVKYKNTGEVLSKHKLELKFRTLDSLIKSLKQCGFTTINVYEDGQFKKATDKANYFIFHCIK